MYTFTKAVHVMSLQHITALQHAMALHHAPLHWENFSGQPCYGNSHENV